MKTSVKVIEITPEMATSMLEMNTRNRPVSKNHVNFLTNEMLRGNWRINGDTIAISDEDSIIDGQHRLMACVQSGVAFETYVVKGLPKDVFDTKDVGKRRSSSDTLATKGEINTASLGAGLSFVAKYLAGDMVKKHSIMSNIDIEETLAEHPGIRESTHHILALFKKRRFVMPGTMIGCHYLFGLKDAELSDLFFEQLATGQDIRKGAPVYLLRERLMTNAMSKMKLSRTEIAALIIKAWNFTRSGRNIGRLTWLRAEEFPEIK